MRLGKIYFIIFALVVLGSSHDSFAQRGGFKMKTLVRHEQLSVWLSAGPSMYFGDICEKFECMVPRINSGIGLQFRASNHFSTKLEANYFRVHSTDVFPDRNLTFRSYNIETYLAGIFDYFPYTKHYRKRKKIVPYAFLGIGFTYFNPKAQSPSTGTWESLRPLRTEGQATPYSSITPIIPFGIGFKIKSSKHLDFIVEGGYRVTFTDYLDDVSSYFWLDTAQITDEKTKEFVGRYNTGGESQYKPNTGNPDPVNGTITGSQRGNPSKNDGYFIFKLGIRYTINPKTKFLLKKHHPVSHPHVK